MNIKYQIEEVVREVKYKIQRANKGYSEVDTWNFEEYVARLIKENCFLLAENCNGYPDQIKGMTPEKWKQVLLDISFGFGSYVEMRSGVYNYDDKEFKRLSKEYRNGLKLFCQFHEFLWD